MVIFHSKLLVYQRDPMGNRENYDQNWRIPNFSKTNFLKVTVITHSERQKHGCSKTKRSGGHRICPFSRIANPAVGPCHAESRRVGFRDFHAKERHPIGIYTQSEMLPIRTGHLFESTWGYIGVGQNLVLSILMGWTSINPSYDLGFTARCQGFDQ